MRTLLPLLLVLVALAGCHAQDQNPAQSQPKTNISFINNRDIKGTFVLMACRTCAPVRSVGYRVVVTLSEAQQATLKRITPATWLALLDSSSTDFSANLLLYSLYDKDALVLSENNSPEVWRQYQKPEDVAFWTTALKKPPRAAR